MGGASGRAHRLPYLPETINYRIYVWTTEFIPLVLKHLVTGFGPDTPPNIAFPYTESIYFELLLRGGLPLLFMYAGLMLALAWRARDLRNDLDVERRAVAQTTFLLIILGAFIQLITPYFVDAGFPFLFWVLAGLLISGKGTRERRQWTTSPRAVPVRNWPRPFLVPLPAYRALSGKAGAGGDLPPRHLRGVGTVLRGFAVLSAATVLIRLIGFVAITLLARRAGPQAFGTYAFALALIGFVVGTPTDFGFGTLGIRKIARDPRSAGKVVGEALAVQAIIAAFCVALLVALMPLFSGDSELVALTPLIAIYYVAYSMTVDWALQGLQRLPLVAVARLSGQVILGIVTPLILVSGPAGAERYAMVFAGGATVTAIVAFVMVRRAVGPIRMSFAIAPQVFAEEEGG